MFVVSVAMMIVGVHGSWLLGGSSSFGALSTFRTVPHPEWNDEQLVPSLLALTERLPQISSESPLRPFEKEFAPLLNARLKLDFGSIVKVKGKIEAALELIIRFDNAPNTATSRYITKIGGKLREMYVNILSPQQWVSTASPRYVYLDEKTQRVVDELYRLIAIANVFAKGSTSRVSSHLTTFNWGMNNLQQLFANHSYDDAVLLPVMQDAVPKLQRALDSLRSNSKLTHLGTFSTYDPRLIYQYSTYLDEQLEHIQDSLAPPVVKHVKAIVAQLRCSLELIQDDVKTVDNLRKYISQQEKLKQLLKNHQTLHTLIESDETPDTLIERYQTPHKEAADPPPLRIDSPEISTLAQLISPFVEALNSIIALAFFDKKKSLDSHVENPLDAQVKNPLDTEAKATLSGQLTSLKEYLSTKIELIKGALTREDDNYERLHIKFGAKLFPVIRKELERAKRSIQAANSAVIELS